MSQAKPCASQPSARIMAALASTFAPSKSTSSTRWCCAMRRAMAMPSAPPPPPPRATGPAGRWFRLRAHPLSSPAALPFPRHPARHDPSAPLDQRPLVVPLVFRRRPGAVARAGRRLGRPDRREVRQRSRWRPGAHGRGGYPRLDRDRRGLRSRPARKLGREPRCAQRHGRCSGAIPWLVGLHHPGRTTFAPWGEVLETFRRGQRALHRPCPAKRPCALPSSPRCAPMSPSSTPCAMRSTSSERTGLGLVVDFGNCWMERDFRETVAARRAAYRAGPGRRCPDRRRARPGHGGRRRTGAVRRGRPADRAHAARCAG